ncbi:MAG: 2,3-bisphosphoglycerate-independent phosphoglycerate mutase, partial [Actinobacteria bacterium]|nr:2,3-bisphosphoglycerate-independent phosphoglycerate mutase [Actinomycetota bacterium]
ITESYNKGKSDEFIEPYIMTKKGKKLPRIKNNDSIIFFNLRSDRARQLAKIFVQKDFNKRNPGSFKRKKVLKNLHFVALTDFGPDLDNILTAYPGIDLRKTLPMQLKNLSQLYIAETEKYAHMTYFFNGGYANPVNGEARMAIPSPNVKSYDKTPSMSSLDLTEAVVNSVKHKKYDFIAMNFAAPDMMGHTGNLKAGIKCCESIDKYLSRIIKQYMRVNGAVIITADHGNVEKMVDLTTDEIITKHSDNPVPFILVGKKFWSKIKLRKGGTLGDIAPTILDLIGIKKPREMTGKSLVK